MAVSLLRLPEVIQRTGLRRATVYREIALGRFPRPVKPTERTAAWPDDEIDEWINDRIRESREGR